jgi:hypothetical protein
MLVDVGGGHGRLLSMILAAYPKMRGVLFDLPHALEGGQTTIAEAGLAGRCEVVSGDFFRSVPTGGDAYVLSRVIHDWADEKAVAILKRVRGALGPKGRLLLFETMIRGDNRLSYPLLSDLNMVIRTGGCEEILSKGVDRLHEGWLGVSDRSRPDAPRCCPKTSHFGKAQRICFRSSLTDRKRPQRRLPHRPLSESVPSRPRDRISCNDAVDRRPRDGRSQPDRFAAAVSWVLPNPIGWKPRVSDGRPGCRLTAGSRISGPKDSSDGDANSVRRSAHRKSEVKAMFYQVVRQCSRSLANLQVCLDKAVQHAAAKKFDIDILLTSRLAPDQQHFIYQVQSACDYVKGAAGWLSGQAPPKHEDNEKTLDEVRERIRKTIAFVESVGEDQYAGASERRVKLSWAPGKVIAGSDYLLQVTIPNVFFHITTAYAILRHNGVDVGKMDFLGAMNFVDG